jgi:hypothetical protein
MADNVTLNPGAGGEVVAADDIAGVLFQRIKPTFGPDGTAVDVSDANPLPTRDEGLACVLRRILQMLIAPLGYDKSLQRQRGTVVVESGTVTTVSTVTTVAALTNLVNVGGYPAQMPVFDQNRSAWAQCVRARIT